MVISCALNLSPSLHSSFLWQQVPQFFFSENTSLSHCQLMNLITADSTPEESEQDHEIKVS